MQQPTLAEAGNIASPDAVDPYPLWHHARREAPVGFVGEMNGGRPTYWVTRWADVEAVLRDNETYLSSINAESMREVMGTMLVGMDGVEHRRYRDLVAKAFRASSLERWGDELID